jgi:hypothetical protein
MFGNNKKSDINKIVLKKDFSIGAISAEDDTNYIANCFIDNGEIDLLTNFNESRCIILGRTGAGKSAIIEKIKEQEKNHYITIKPAAIAMEHIQNSGILEYVKESGVQMLPFYKVLWQHILIINLIKKRFEGRKSISDVLSTIITPKKELLSNYMSEWGDKFWQDTDSVIKEFTNKTEVEISAELSAYQAKIAAGQKLDNQEKEQIRLRLKNIINPKQFRALSEITEFMQQEILNNKKNKFYILIDHLDEQWTTDDDMRCHLIRGLIDTIKEFQSFRINSNVKIIVSLRNDLFNRVIEKTKTPGQQTEKIKSYFIEIKWSKEKLIELVEKRTKELFKRKYSGQQVELYEVLKNQDEIMDYMIERTFYRPRDIIEFFNLSIEAADEKSKISLHEVKQAEWKFSSERIAALFEEWEANHPCIRHYVEPLRGKKTPFQMLVINKDFLSILIANCTNNNDEIINLIRNFHYDETMDIQQVAAKYLNAMYQFGILGLKPNENYISYIWSFKGDTYPELSISKDNCMIAIHPMFYLPLEIKS